LHVELSADHIRIVGVLGLLVSGGGRASTAGAVHQPGSGVIVARIGVGVRVRVGVRTEAVMVQLGITLSPVHLSVRRLLGGWMFVIQLRVLGRLQQMETHGELGELSCTIAVPAKGGL
jgi:hypothetical protein